MVGNFCLPSSGDRRARHMGARPRQPSFATRHASTIIHSARQHASPLQFNSLRRIVPLRPRPHHCRQPCWRLPPNWSCLRASTVEAGRQLASRIRCASERTASHSAPAWSSCGEYARVGRCVHMYDCFYAPSLVGYVLAWESAINYRLHVLIWTGGPCNT
jgi:hypothetical protein